MKKYLIGLLLFSVVAFAIDRDVTSRDGSVVVNGFTSIKNQINSVDKMTINSSGLTFASAFPFLQGLGTVGAPSYSFIGDTDTGMWSAGPNALNFSVSGNEVVSINSSRFLGVGDTNPGVKVSIIDGSNATLTVFKAQQSSVGAAAIGVSDIIRTNNGAISASIGSTANGGNPTISTDAASGVFSIGAASSIPVVLKTGATERMRIDSTGNTTFNDSIKVKAPVGGTALWFLGRASDGLSQIGMRNNADTTWQQLVQFPADGSYIFNSGASNTERMRIDSSGNIGVGGTPPSISHRFYGKTVSGDVRMKLESTGANNYDQSIEFADPNSSWFVGNRFSGDQLGFGIGRTSSKDDLIVDSAGRFAMAGGSESSGPRLLVQGLGELISGVGSKLATIRVTDTAGSAGNGGAIEFGAAGSSYFAAIKGYLTNSANNTAGNMVFYTRNASTDPNLTGRMTVQSDGVINITNLAGVGSRAVNADASGSLSAASDSRLKKEVFGTKLPGLKEVMKLEPKAYKWLDDIKKRGEKAAIEVGFFADQVAPIIPSAAPKGNDGYYGFYDRSVTAALVNAVKELKAENDELKKRLDKLEAKFQ
jgi:hypothetical protein